MTKLGGSHLPAIFLQAFPSFQGLVGEMAEQLDAHPLNEKRDGRGSEEPLYIK